ncbi:MAG: anti-sigma factor [Chitinophagales bacterium]
MEAKEIIESGALELYVLGALSAGETRQIDDLRRTHPELNEEIERIERTLEELGNAQAVMPEPALKEKIADKLQFGVELDLDMEKVSSVIVELTPLFKFAAAAAIFIIVGLVATTYYFSSRYSAANREIAQLKADKDVLANRVNLIEQESKSVKEELAIMADPNNKAVTLKGQAIAKPGTQATVYWNANKGEVHLLSAQLPTLADNEQYQLWAIVGGKPVDLGVLNKANSFSKMKDALNAQAFAITIEPFGGSTTPTLEKMVVLGNV